MADPGKKENAKLLEELVSYLIDNGYYNLTTSIDVVDGQTLFIVKVKSEDKKLHDKFKLDLFCCRDEEMEEFDWKSINEVSCVCNLHHLGNAVDHYTITHEGEYCKLVLYKKM